MKIDQKNLTKLFGSSCYAMCCSYIGGSRNTLIVLDVLNGVELGYVTPDGWVIQPSKIAKCHDVLKIPLTDFRNSYKILDGVLYHQGKRLGVLVGIAGCFEFNGGTHFVVLKPDLSVDWDPYEGSLSLKCGTLTSVRLFLK